MTPLSNTMGNFSVISPNVKMFDLKYQRNSTRIMSHDNISSTHGKNDNNTWTVFDVTWNIFHVWNHLAHNNTWTVFDVTWNIFHVWNHLAHTMSHDLYHVTWCFSCQGMPTCDMIMIMSHEKKILHISQDHVNMIFLKALGELSC
jgi:hypothetical protein